MSPLVLMILDGWGLGEATEGNAVKLAATPCLESLFARYSHTRLACSGEAVGLLPGQMGDSNVGHTNIGAGRVVYQPLVRVNRALADGSLAASPALAKLWSATRGGGALHLLTLVSDGGVHSHQDHLLAVLRLAKEQGVAEIYVHAFLDGRDVPPQSALSYIGILEDFLAELGIGKIATVAGRFYAMDRDSRWERTELAYQALVEGRGPRAASAAEAVTAGYEVGVTDEFLPPTVITREGCIKAGDGVFMVNFRADRARQLMHALLDEEFSHFPRGPHLPLTFASLTPYEADFWAPYVLPNADLSMTLGETLSSHGLSQLRLAETEKYAHVTFFLNGGREVMFPGEERILVPSPRVATYDLQPEMSADEITAELLTNLKKFDCIIVNYANLDMVGHTGNLEAAIHAVETVDSCVGRVAEAIEEIGGILLLTADHGNAEQMWDPLTGAPHTAHTANPVPLLLQDPLGRQLAGPGMLADIAPTLLNLLNLPKPDEMTGSSLLKG